ncbi:LytR/AlgR family response regulator transcription factor [Enterococcus sp. AZ192]|uniref:LytR/AlgR family response regulator transcription factor n=1 Tax=unclassified Enterococcus TaxID=2608891 RepID=UPI003D28A03B
MVRVYICDDHEGQLKQITRYVDYFCSFSKWNMHISATSTSPEKLFQEIQIDDEINIYLLDLNFAKVSEMNGLDLGLKIRQIDPLGFLIYITSHIEMSFLTFQYKVNAFDFIIKSGVDQLQTKINDSLKAVEQRLATINAIKIKETLEVDLGYGMGTFFLEEIIAFEAAGHKIYLYTEKQMKMLKKTTLAELEMKLPKTFIRCHRGYIINSDKISVTAKDGSFVQMVNQMEFPVSSRKRKLVRSFL